MTKKNTLIALIMLIMGAIATQAATYSGTLPVMFINTDGGVPITSKEDYVYAEYYIDNISFTETRGFLSLFYINIVFININILPKHQKSLSICCQ